MAVVMAMMGSEQYVRILLQLAAVSILVYGQLGEEKRKKRTQIKTLWIPGSERLSTVIGFQDDSSS